MPRQAAQPRRRSSLRLRGFDYSSLGAYSVTICTWQRHCMLGDIVDGLVRLSPPGEIVTSCWSGIGEHFSFAAVDVSIVMPNHVHGILFIQGEGPLVGSVGATHAVSHRRAAGLRGTNGASPLRVPGRPSGPAPASLSAVVGAFKAGSARLVNRHRGTPGALVRQRGFYDHVIRDEADLDRIRRYIEENPLRWDEDPEDPPSAITNMGANLRRGGSPRPA